MSRAIKLAVPAGLVLGLVLIQGCKDPGQSDQGNKSGAAATPYPSYSPGPTYNPNAVYPSPVPTQCVPTNGITPTTTLPATTGTLSYQNDIKPIIDQYCANSCHSPMGGRQPDLTTYTSVQMYASSIVADVSSGKMPQNSQLPSNYQQAIIQWVNAGAPQMPTTTGIVPTTLATPYPGAVANVNCNPTPTLMPGTIGPGGIVNPLPTVDPWAQLLTPPQMQQCQAMGKIYDRQQAICHKADIAKSYSCTDQGVMDEFKKFNIDTAATIQSFEAGGFQLDQCGEYNGDPIVFYIAKVNGTDTIKLQIKKLCRSGSPACTNP